MNYTLQRTQIYLPKDLRDEIDRHRALTGESLAEYLRAAAKLRVKKEKKRQKDLNKIVNEIFAKPIKKSAWDGIDVIKWQRRIREDRDLNVHS